MILMDHGVKVRENIQALRQSISESASKVDRAPSEIKLVLVTKTIATNVIQQAVDAGEFVFGENRVQELNEKQQALSEKIEWHLIGHLQTNKVKHVVGKVALIHSLDRLELAEAIEAFAEKRELGKIDCLIQVNSSGETSKFGLKPDEVEDFIVSVEPFSFVNVRGLMTIGPNTRDDSLIRKSFSLTRKLFDQLKKEFPQLNFDTLSMGMSGDYQIAIEEGSTMIRVGSAVFGARE